MAAMTQPAGGASVLSAIEHRASELEERLRTLVGFDTTTRLHDAEPARDEREAQAFLGQWLREIGFEVEIFEPEPLAPCPQVPSGASFAGRPQLIARKSGRISHAPSVVINGHIDVVSSEPASEWGGDPFTLRNIDGRLIGRGATDMKGGIVASLIALEVLHEQGIELDGDVLVNTVTDEELNGAGTLASIAHGLQADAGIVPEPSDLVQCVRNRGILSVQATFAGRSGHADIPQPHWREGGAVNAIECAGAGLGAIAALRNEWRAAALSDDPIDAGSIVPTLISGGEWAVSYPATASFDLDITYTSAQADDEGLGTHVQAELEQRIRESAPDAEWQDAHPTTFRWYADLPPAETPRDAEIVTAVAAALDRIGRPSAPMPHPSWTDASSLTRAGIPSVVVGPTATQPDGASTLHIVDEYAELADLIDTAKVIALTLIEICGASAREDQ